MMEYPEPTTQQPTDEELEYMIFWVSEATDGCFVEPDGECEHGYPSWLVYLEMI